MTYIQSRNKSRSPGLVIVIVVMVVLVAIILVWPHFFPSLVTSFVRPFWRGQVMIQMGSLETKESLMAQNEKLLMELQAAEVDLASVRSLQNENEELKAILGRNPLASSTLVLGAVLRRPPALAYDEIIVDVGSEDGVAVGASVYAPGEVLIGTVRQTLSRSSKVILLTSPGETHEVFIGENRAPATAKGRGGGQYVVELPRDIEVKEGDVVIESNRPNRSFGIVSSVQNDPVQPFEKIYFAPPINIFELRWVLVDRN